MRPTLLGLCVTMAISGGTTFGVMSVPTAAEAGVIERACLTSGRRAANRSLCGCIQTAADKTLSRSEQRKAARFFEDPHRAQEVRMSDRASDEVFWDRYRAFGSKAQSICR